MVNVAFQADFTSTRSIPGIPPRGWIMLVDKHPLTPIHCDAAVQSRSLVIMLENDYRAHLDQNYVQEHFKMKWWKKAAAAPATSGENYLCTGKQIPIKTCSCAYSKSAHDAEIPFCPGIYSNKCWSSYAATYTPNAPSQSKTRPSLSHYSIQRHSFGIKMKLWFSLCETLICF